jgi:hypothetical protein
MFKTYLSTSKTSVTGQLTSVKLNNLLVISTRNNLILFSEDNLDVRGRGHERVDTTVSTVSTTTVLGSLVNNDAGDIKFLNIQTLSLKQNNVNTFVLIYCSSEFFFHIYMYITSALLSAFFKRSVTNLTDLTGQRP